MGIEHKITLTDDVPADDVMHPLLTGLPHFTEYNTEYGLYNFGSTSTAATESIESDGFLVCDHLIDRELAREVLDALIQGIGTLGSGVKNVFEV
jgi:hypothetical protein